MADISRGEDHLISRGEDRPAADNLAKAMDAIIALESVAGLRTTTPLPGNGNHEHEYRWNATTQRLEHDTAIVGKIPKNGTDDVQQVVRQAVADFGRNVAMLETREQGLFIGTSVSSSQHLVTVKGPRRGVPSMQAQA